MNTTQRNTNLSGLNVGDEGLLIYNTTDSEFNYWDGTQWIPFPAGGAANDNDWDRNAGSGYLFPSNLTDFVGIGTNAPAFPLSVNATNRGNAIYVNANFTNALATGANSISTSVAGASGQKLNGISQLISANGTGTRSGILNTFEGSGSGELIGIENYFNNSGGGNRVGLKNSVEVLSSASRIYGIQNSFALATGTNAIYGMENTFFSNNNADHYGLFSSMVTSGPGEQYGIYNSIDGTGSAIQVGTYNEVTNNGIANIYGVQNVLDGNNAAGITYGNSTTITGTGLGNKYGSKILIDPGASGTHYGIYAEALKSGSYAGYFLGNTYIGTNTSNGYIMPVVDGNDGDVITTNGSGLASWIPRTQKVIFKDMRPSSASPSAGAANTWTTRPLNVTEGSATFASLAANRVTLRPGSYSVNAICPISQSPSDHVQSIIYDVSNNAVLVQGIPIQSQLGGVSAIAHTVVSGIFTIAANTTIELRSISATAFQLGNTITFTNNHVFTVFEIEKLN